MMLSRAEPPNPEIDVPWCLSEQDQQWRYTMQDLCEIALLPPQPSETRAAVSTA